MRRVFVATAGLLLLGTLAHAQLRGVKAELTPLTEAAGVEAGHTLHLALGVRLPEGMHVQSHQPRDPALIPTVLSIEPPAHIAVVEMVYPQAIDLKQEGLPQPLAVYPREFALGVALTIAAGTPPGTVEVPARLRYQACNDKMCFAPATASFAWRVTVVPAGRGSRGARDPLFDTIRFGQGTAAVETPSGGVAASSSASPAQRFDIKALDGFAVAGTTGGYLRVQEFLDFVHNAEAGIRPQGWFEGRGPLAILLIVLVGGIALNLTPCVLPMIPINLAIIGAGATAASRKRGFWLGAAYGSAMALVYGVLGVIVILTAGTFGTLNASAWFNLAIAVLFVGLALAMFDVFEIDFSRFSTAFNPSAGTGTFVLAFSMGAVAALLAGACVAPVVIQVVLFASNLYSTGTTIALGLPFVLGVGMAIPWPIAGAGLASLPRPGAWMVRVKQAFGVLILVTAAYYGYEAYQLFANRWVDGSAVQSSVDEQLKAGWHASLAEGLEVARREQKPVLIDFWATWCKNCLTMDKTTLADETVRSALDGYVKVKFQAEDPDAEPARSTMARFKAVGLPTYVILKPGAAPVRSSSLSR